MEAMKKKEKTFHKVNIDDAVLANQQHRRAESVGNNLLDQNIANEEEDY